MIQCLSESQNGLTIDDIAAKLSCSKRTVQRNLALFREYDIPLNEIVGEKGKKTYRIVLTPPALSFAFDEIAAVYVSRRFLEPMMGTLFWKAMQNALKKMRLCLGPQMVRHLERSVGVIEQTAFGRSDYREFAEIIDDLNFATEENRRVMILYRTHKEEKASTTKVDPYGLVYHFGSLYLIGFSHKRNEIRHWKIDRMQGVTVSNDSFQPPDDFHFAEYVGQLLGIFKRESDKEPQLIRIRFHSFYAQQIQEKRWHPSEKFVAQKDGSVIMELKMAELPLLERWVLGYGHYAEVLEPPELREMVHNEVQKIAAYYSDQ